MNPFGEENPFADFDPNTAGGGFMGTLILYAVVANLNDVHYRLSMIKKTLQQYPDTFSTENSFELNAVITEFIDKMIEIRKKEIRTIMERNPAVREELERMGIDPNELN